MTGNRSSGTAGYRASDSAHEIADVEAARRLPDDAHAKCFIANSVNFPVGHEPLITVDYKDA